MVLSSGMRTSCQSDAPERLMWTGVTELPRMTSRCSVLASDVSARTTSDSSLPLKVTELKVTHAPGDSRRAFHPANVSVESRNAMRSEEHTSELQSRGHLVCRLLLEK